MTDKAIDAAARAVADQFDTDADASSEVFAQAAISAYLTQREAEGFVMVPVEPSEAMLEAGDMGLSDAGVDDSTREDAAYCYRAMIAARPQVKG